MNLENKKQIAIIALAVGLGLVAVVLTGNHVQSQINKETRSLANHFQKQDVALQNQMEMMRTEMKRLAEQQMAVAQRQKSAATTQKAPVTPEIPKSTLALRTPPGKRALTINIDSLSAVGGLINPGDYVDILGHLNVPKTASKPHDVTAIIFQNIQVLAVGTNLSALGGYTEQQKARSLTITLALDPEEAGLVTFAQKNGKLQFILRAQAETETEMVQAASWETFSEYVLNKNGLDLAVPRQGAMIETIGGGIAPGQTEEVKPYIQIFRGGREL